MRRIKTTIYTPLIPTFSLKGEGAGTCVDTYATGLRLNCSGIERTIDRNPFLIAVFDIINRLLNARNGAVPRHYCAQGIPETGIKSPKSA